MVYKIAWFPSHIYRYISPELLFKSSSSYHSPGGFFRCSLCFITKNAKNVCFSSTRTYCSFHSACVKGAWSDTGVVCCELHCFCCFHSSVIVCSVLIGFSCLWLFPPVSDYLFHPRVSVSHFSCVSRSVFGFLFCFTFFPPFAFIYKNVTIHLVFPACVFSI